MVKTVLLECFIEVIVYDECSIRVYRSWSNIFMQAQIFSYLLCLSWRNQLVSTGSMQYIYTDIAGYGITCVRR